MTTTIATTKWSVELPECDTEEEWQRMKAMVEAYLETRLEDISEE